MPRRLMVGHLPLEEGTVVRIHAGQQMKIKLTLLGTGTFFVRERRSSSAYLLEAGGKKILIDCGPGTLMRLSQVGVNPLDLDYILVTHFHADHTSDLFPLIMNCCLDDFYTGGKLLKFPEIIGPKGIRNFVLKTTKNCRLLVFKKWDKIKFTDVKKEEMLSDILLKSYRVRHIAFGLEAGGFAFRFNIGDKVIAFSGDTVKCLGVEKVCKNADIFVSDASYAKGKANMSHMDTSDVGIMAQKSKVKKVILSHLYPQTDDIDLVSEVKEKFFGEIVRGKDFMTIVL